MTWRLGRSNSELTFVCAILLLVVALTEYKSLCRRDVLLLTKPGC